MKNFSPRGAPFLSISSKGPSVSASASSSGLAIVAEQVEDRQVVAQRLPAGGRRDDDHVAAGLNAVEGFGLVRVEASDAALVEDGPEAGVDGGGYLRVDPFGRRLVVDGADGGIG